MPRIKLTCSCGGSVDYDGTDVFIADRQRDFYEHHEPCNGAEEIHDALLTLEGIHQELGNIARAIEKVGYTK